MPAYKDKTKGTWYASFYYTNWDGKREKKMKRGFRTRREALEWERFFLQQKSGDLEMTFDTFVDLYAKDMRSRIKETTWLILLFEGVIIILIVATTTSAEKHS